MRTVVTEFLGDRQIIKAFDKPVIDPFGTARENKLVYFTPKPGEFFISENQYKQLSRALELAKPGEVVTREGETISIVDTMTEEEIAAAREATLDALLSKATTERSRLEIKGDTAALAKVQKWYQEKAKEVDRFYGVERGDHD